MSIPGLPAGVAVVGFGQLELVDPPTQFVLGDNGALYPEGFGLMVELLPNWTAEWDKEFRRYVPVEHFEPQTVTIEVTNSQGLRDAEDAKAKIETAAAEKA